MNKRTPVINERC